VCVYAPVNLRESCGHVQECLHARVSRRMGEIADEKDAIPIKKQIKLHSMQYRCDNTAFKLENRASFGRHESSDPLAPCHKHADKGRQ